MHDSEGLALLEAARKSPGDAAIRLVLSDWLEERGEDEAASFLRESLHHPNERRTLSLAAASRWRPVSHFYNGWPSGLVTTTQDSEFLKSPAWRWMIALKVKLKPDELNKVAAVIDLIESAHLTNLASLDLELQGIGDAGAEALARSPHLAKLTALSLSGNGITAVGARAMAESPQLANLIYLELNRNRIENRGAEALAQTPYFAELISLNLESNSIGDAGARALAESPYLDKLIYLKLKQNSIQNSLAHRRLRDRFPNVDL